MSLFDFLRPKKNTASIAKERLRIIVSQERSTRGGEFGWPAGFEPLRARRYGEGTFWYGRAASTCEDAR